MQLGGGLVAAHQASAIKGGRDPAALEGGDHTPGGGYPARWRLHAGGGGGAEDPSRLATAVGRVTAPADHPRWGGERGSGQRPVAGAEVSLHYRGRRPPLVTTTDSAGNFFFDGWCAETTTPLTPPLNIPP
jgi:hypothetical protein